MTTTAPGGHVVLALGGGYGHASRVAAARHTLGLTRPADVLVSDPQLPRALLPGCRLSAPPAALRRDRPGLARWVADWLARRAPSLVWVDAFPAGVIGELGPGLAPGARWELLARRVRWAAYAPRVVACPAYARAWVTEPLEAAYRTWLTARCAELVPLTLTDPPADPAPAAALDLPPRCWLVVHSGPPSEVARLAEAARDLAGGLPLVVVAPAPPASGRLPSGVVTWRPVVPASPLADRPEVAGVVTAGGASAVRQYAHLGARHRILPLPRRLDDQAWRAAGGAG